MPFSVPEKWPLPATQVNVGPRETQGLLSCQAEGDPLP